MRCKYLQTCTCCKLNEECRSATYQTDCVFNGFVTSAHQLPFCCHLITCKKERWVHSFSLDLVPAHHTRILFRVSIVPQQLTLVKNIYRISTIDLAAVIVSLLLLYVLCNHLNVITEQNMHCLFSALFRSLLGCYRTEMRKLKINFPCFYSGKIA